MADISLSRLEPSEATAEQLREFWETTLGNEPFRDSVTKASMVKKYAEAGVPFVFIAKQSPDLVPGLAAVQTPGADDRCTDPETERWAKIRLELENNPSENAIEAPVYVSVNQETAYLPRNVIVWVREIFYWTLRDSVRIEWRSKHSTSGHGSVVMLKDVKKVRVPNYPMAFFGWGGLVSKGPPVNMSEDEFLISGPTTTEDAMRISREQERRFHDQLLGEAAAPVTATV